MEKPLLTFRESCVIPFHNSSEIIIFDQISLIVAVADYTVSKIQI